MTISIPSKLEPKKMLTKSDNTYIVYKCCWSWTSRK